MTEWFMCIFARTLPWASVLRVWDMFFCEGISIAIQAMRGLGFSWCLPGGGLLVGCLLGLRPGLGSATNPEAVLPPRNLRPMAAHFSWGLSFLMCKVGSRQGWEL